MSIRTCCREWCSNSLDGKYSNAKYCSQRCASGTRPKSNGERFCSADGCDVDISGMHRNAIYCSTRCKRGRRKPSQTCERCGTGIPPSADGRRRYCSTRCRRGSRSPSSVCEVCGLLIPGSAHGNTRYCSARCNQAAWRDNNLERRRALAVHHEHVRRARKVEAYVEHVDRRVVWERDSGICHICLLPADPHNWHLDHVFPLSRGGEHSYANVAVSHPTCNLRKGDRLPA